MGLSDFFELKEHKGTEIILWSLFKEKLQFELDSDETKLATDDKKMKML